MEPEFSRIAVRSRRQAMDWSLVLTSHGIEPIIDPPGETSGWGLLVEPHEYEAALEAIRLYRRENRNWPWQQPMLRTDLIFDWGSLAWVVLILMFFLLPGSDAELKDIGAVDTRAVTQGQWWRLFTAIWLHVDVAHLAMNATIGVVLLGLAMGRFGTGCALLAAVLAGAGGNVASWLGGTQPHRSLGASGMVMAALGLLASGSLDSLRHGALPLRRLLGGIFGGTMLFVLIGLTPGTDVLAHFGGFVCGAILGAVLAIAPTPLSQNRANVICGGLFVLAVIVPWLLALITRH